MGHNWCLFKSSVSTFNLIHYPMKNVSRKFPQMVSYQCSDGPAWTTPVSTRRSTSNIKRIQHVEDVDLLITYEIVLQGLLWHLDVETMDILRRCAKTQNINRRSDVHATEVTKKTDNRQRKENRKRKIQRDREGLQGFTRKTLTLCGTSLFWIKDSQFNNEVLKQLEDAHQEI